MMTFSSRVLVWATAAIAVLLSVGFVAWQFFGGNQLPPSPPYSLTEYDYAIGSEPVELREYTLPPEAGSAPGKNTPAGDAQPNTSVAPNDSLESIESDLDSTVILEEDFSNL